MRIYGEVDENKLNSSLVALGEFVREHYNPVTETKTAVERVYGSYYGVPLVPDLDLTEADELIRDLYFFVRLSVRENRTKIHPLEERLEEAFRYLHISEERASALAGDMSYFDTSFCWNTNAADRRLYSTYFESIRVALMSIAIGELIDLPEELRVPFFETCFLHDIGKVGVFQSGNSGKRWPDYKPEMRRHPSIGAEISREYGEVIAAAIERTHLFQRDAYPELFKTRETPEALYLAKLTAMIDVYDSASTRDNHRVHVPELLKLVGKRLPTRTGVKEEILNTKGEIDFSQEKKEFGFPYKDARGFILSLYEIGVFGRANVFNPFPETKSFSLNSFKR